MDLLVFVHHPDHVLAVGHNIGGRNILEGPDVISDLAHPAAADAFLFAFRKMMRVADDPALAAAQGDIHHRALPGHPGGQSSYGVHCFLGVKADAALAGAAGIVVLDPKALKHLDGAVVHPDRDVEVILPHGVAQEITGCLIEPQFFGHAVELFLGHLKGIKGFVSHENQLLL